MSTKWVCRYCRAFHDSAWLGPRQHCGPCDKTRTKDTTAQAPRTGRRATALSNTYPLAAAQRVRIGHTEDVPGWNDNGTLRSGQWFKFYVPSSFGPAAAVLGRGVELKLTLKVEPTATAKIRYHGLGDASRRRPPQQKEPEITVPLAQNSQGWYYAQIDGSTAARVTVRLFERGYARNAAAEDAAPLIPWNFHYWSFSRYSGKPVAFLPRGDDTQIWGHYNVLVDGYSPYDHFDEHFNLNFVQNKRRPGGVWNRADFGASLAWESDPANAHCVPENSDAENKGWEGHCNYGASAAIYFDTPQAAHGMDAEELKLFATENAANFGQTQRIWTLGGGTDPATAPAFNADMEIQEQAPSHIRPPTDVKAVANYAAANPTEMTLVVNTVYPVTGIPTNGWYRYDNNGHADDRKKIPANQCQPNLPQWKITRGDDAKAVAWRRTFGTNAVNFHTVLRQHLAQGGHALLMDMRADDAKTNKAQIWNQALFYYLAEFIEHPDSDGAWGNERRCAQDIQLHVALIANADTWPTNQPAAEAHATKGCLVDGRHNFWARFARYRIQFDNAGALIANDACNDWEACTQLSGRRDQDVTAMSVAARQQRLLQVRGEIQQAMGNDAVGHTQLFQDNGTWFVGRPIQEVADFDQDEGYFAPRYLDLLQALHGPPANDIGGVSLGNAEVTTARLGQLGIQARARV